MEITRIAALARFGGHPPGDWGDLRQRRDSAPFLAMWKADSEDPAVDFDEWAAGLDAVVRWLWASDHENAVFHRGKGNHRQPRFYVNNYAGLCQRMEDAAESAPPVDEATTRALRLLDCVLADDFAGKSPEGVRQAKEAAMRLGGPEGIRRRLDDECREDVAHRLWMALSDVTGGAA